jgi:uncharacterized protein
MELLDEVCLRQMVYGGAVLGGGGGGTISAGLEAGRKALRCGTPRLAKLSELPRYSSLVTLSRVGTVGGEQSVEMLDRHESESLKLFLKSSEQKISGFLPSEVGPLAVTYGWKASAITGLPVVDAPCNGRAHPLGLMGSLGLHGFPRHLTLTAAVGGAIKNSNRVEIAIKSNAQHAAEVVRNIVARVKVPLAVTRNPLPASYVRRHAAVDALSVARRIGKELLRHIPAGCSTVLRALSALMRGRLLAKGVVESVELREQSGFSLGHIMIARPGSGPVMVAVCNEYMVALEGGATLAVFPDLISIFNRETALPLGSAEVRRTQKVVIFGVPRKNLLLGSTMKDRRLLHSVERLLKMDFPVMGMSRTKADSGLLDSRAGRGIVAL